MALAIFGAMGIVTALNPSIIGAITASDSCGSSEFKCVESGICILKALVCDGEPDCSQGEDEVDCDHSCNDKDLFKCK